MNEYQDQAVWFEVRIRGAYGRWIPAQSDHGVVLTGDTREEAEALGRQEIRADIPFEVFRRRGQS